MKKIVLLQKKWEKKIYPEGRIIGYKSFDSIKEIEKYMLENRLNINLNNGIFHTIINFKELTEMNDKI